jgi:hypothetical protein
LLFNYRMRRVAKFPGMLRCALDVPSKEVLNNPQD